ncbi:crosslink repair DNA glycosylase YcaQ family protein [Angustibacter aerolatus]
MSRDQVLALRVAAQQLDRRVDEPGELAVLDLGLADTGTAAAALALSARLPDVVTAEQVTADRSLARVWALRGAPHVHRRVDLPGLARALWPVSDDDATARLRSDVIKQGKHLGLAAFTATAQAFADVVTTRTPKGAASTGVSARIPHELTYWCASCEAQHVSALPFQQTALAASLELVPDGRGIALQPVEHPWPLPDAAVGAGRLVRRVLADLVVASATEVAAVLGSTATALQPVWPADAVEVEVDGRRRFVLPEVLDAVGTHPAPRLTRLLPPGDPWLQARDRDLLLPGTDRQKALWKAINAPGALLVDGELEGTWTAKQGRAGRVLVRVTVFEPLDPATAREVEAEAELVARVRGGTSAELEMAGA